jgi:hypothetical protein
MCLIPEAFREYERRARRAAKCYECGREIAPGVTYSYASGIWDGEPSAYKTCLRCKRLKVLVEKEGYDDGAECGITFGGLFELIRECIGTRGMRRRVTKKDRHAD